MKNIKKGLKKPNLILPYLFNYIFSNESKIRNDICNHKLIWHFCTPKSASSYLVYLLRSCKINTIQSMPYFSNRQQINDFFYLREKIRSYLFSSRRLFYITHQHTPFDNYLKKHISEKHIVIIQTRNIYKTILSLKDMLILENMSKINPWIQWDPNKYNEKDFLKLLIYYYVPFHVNFVKSWIENEIDGKKIFINYEDFINNEKKTLEKILNGQKKIITEIPDFDEVDKKTIKFSVGKERKNTLTIDEKKLIDDIVDINTKYSDPRIKSLIYK